jgi:hypothetical protein
MHAIAFNEGVFAREINLYATPYDGIRADEIAEGDTP